MLILVHYPPTHLRADRVLGHALDVLQRLDDLLDFAAVLEWHGALAGAVTGAAGLGGERRGSRHRLEFAAVAVRADRADVVLQGGARNADQVAHLQLPPALEVQMPSDG